MPNEQKEMQEQKEQKEMKEMQEQKEQKEQKELKDLSIHKLIISLLENESQENLRFIADTCAEIYTRRQNEIRQNARVIHENFERLERLERLERREKREHNDELDCYSNLKCCAGGIVFMAVIAGLSMVMVYCKITV